MLPTALSSIDPKYWWLAAIGLPSTSLVVRIVQRVAQRRAARPALSGTARLMRGVRIVSGALLCLALWRILHMTVEDAVTGALALTFAGVLACSMVIGELVAEPPRLETQRQRQAAWASAAIFAVFGLGTYAATAYLRTPGCPERPVYLAWPVSGAWRVAAGGRNAWLNPHCGRGEARDESVDLVSADPDVPSEGQPVYAPLTGIVTAVIDDDPGDIGVAEGNYILIRGADGTKVTLEHLQTDSSLVSHGDKIKAGERIAEVGGTGNAIEPHLDIHAERNGEPVPMRFGPGGAYLVRGDVIRPPRPMPATPPKPPSFR